jgi:two-component system chemotaxis response regulator CheB
MAASTGGPVAVQTILAGLPANLGLPLLVVQHISPGFTAGLAAWLGVSTGLRVKVAEDGEPLVGGTVYLAPDDRHLTATASQVRLGADPAVGGFRPSATVLFESVARSFGAAGLGVMLTGMGEDGVRGLRALRQAGGRVLAQDEASCVVFGMPGSAIAAGLADAVLPPEAIAARIAAEAGVGRGQRGSR